MLEFDHIYIIVHIYNSIARGIIVQKHNSQN